MLQGVVRSLCFPKPRSRPADVSSRSPSRAPASVEEWRAAAAGLLARLLTGGGSALILATEAHRTALIAQLEHSGLDVSRVMVEGRLVSLDAAECLEMFVRDGTLDPALFQQQLASWVSRLLRNGGELGIVAETSALLRARGNARGASQLEELWAELREYFPFTLCSAPSRPVSPREANASPLPTPCPPRAPELAANTGASATAALDSTRALLRIREEQLERETAERRRLEQAMVQLRQELDASRRDVETRIAERTMALIEANAQLEEFSYTVSHDLRAPLRGMQVYSQALCEDYHAHLPAEAQRYLQRIRENAARLESMVSDVLHLSRLSRAGITLARVNLDALVRKLVSEHPLMQPPRAQITSAKLDDVLGHEASVVQAVSNLLSNAIKFVGPGVTPQVRIWTQPHGSGIRLWVEDNGIGIAPEHQPRLFRLFERVHPASAYEGTGVGLAIVRKAAQRMGGEAGLESDGVHGTRAWIQFQRCATA